MQYINFIDIGKFIDKCFINMCLNVIYMYIIDMFLFNNIVYIDLKRYCLILSYIKKVNYF